MSDQQFAFTLPKGLVMETGEVVREGVMRLATGEDELFVQRHPRVLSNPSYGVLVMLSRTIVRFGEGPGVSAEMLEGLFVVDSAYLQDFFNEINRMGGELSISGE
ncbi:phage tail assembly protein [Spirulina sp. CS-785/01]|uniref:phage tail assembly protein n=1 Tax=Spirulina sp. CS-785/01 TaxID=3021716 RepID=UPI00232E270E|nr:phage tail assembly protein [Spirulina sp. CS-785/01]MDB9314577.1 phage tail assembly protein [Spirulina sp. CS-785/01]